jgi:hypothetical protein
MPRLPAGQRLAASAATLATMFVHRINHQLFLAARGNMTRVRNLSRVNAGVRLPRPMNTPGIASLNPRLNSHQRSGLACTPEACSEFSQGLTSESEPPLVMRDGNPHPGRVRGLEPTYLANFRIATIHNLDSSAHVLGPPPLLLIGMPHRPNMSQEQPERFAREDAAPECSGCPNHAQHRYLGVWRWKSE